MNIVIAAGGTGGHLYPAVALAREFLREEPATGIVFLGTSRGIEGKVLAHEGFSLEHVIAKPVMGVGVGKAAVALLALPIGVWQAIRSLRARRAELVIGIGGYTSPPVLLAAWLLGVPRVILEPNAYPGMANTALSPIANLVFVAFEEAGKHFTRSKVRVVGTPIRRAFLEPAAAAAPAATGGRRLLVFGGSQGAHAINEALVQALPQLVQRGVGPAGLSVIHQTGEADHARVKEAYERTGVQAEVVPFLFDMPRALRSADLVVSRAGAVTVAELTACGKPAILIPLPQAIYRHQERNARVLEAGGAAVVLPQEGLSGPGLARTIAELLGDADRLRAMSERSRALGKTDSAETIVRHCRALVGDRHGVNNSRGAERA